MNGQNRGSQQEQRKFVQLQSGISKLPDWIEKQVDKEAVDFADNFGKYLADQKYSTTQIRNIFGEIKRLQMEGKWSGEIETSLLLLKPKLAYSAKRQTKKDAEHAANDLKEFLCKGIDIVVNSDDKKRCFDNFASIYEAILAYHKAYSK
ncbi:MAG: type III-A CRISPR-associated protein Csm2 [Candidatus Marinimicrobia bacterium]|nr:type III-A CRISPR-associated protein Csm2 [Candidatus Neomarinimicrobiota bacterium]